MKRIQLLRLLGGNTAELSDDDKLRRRALCTVCSLLNPRDPFSAEGYLPLQICKSVADWLLRELPGFSDVAVIERVAATDQFEERYYLYLTTDWAELSEQRRVAKEAERAKTKAWISERYRWHRVYTGLRKMGLGRDRSEDAIQQMFLMLKSGNNAASVLMDNLGYNAPITDEELAEFDDSQSPLRTGVIYDTPIKGQTDWDIMRKHDPDPDTDTDD